MGLKFGKGPNFIQASKAIRLKVFVEEQGIPADEEFDGNDGPETVYVIYYEGDLPVATARYHAVEGAEEFQIGRVATLMEYRRKGYNRQCIQRLEDYGRELGFKKALIHSDLRALGYYESLGYQECSGHYLEDGVECVSVTKTL